MSDQISKTAEQMLFYLKTRGASSAETMAQYFEMTTVGARQHLLKLQENELVKFTAERKSVGRPKRFWQLTDKAQARFPDTHAQLSLEIITSIRDLFGEEGLDKVINKREKESLVRYKQALSTYKALAHKVKKLAELRSVEGYMASYEKCRDGGYLLIENHCPICAAASECQNFCRSELAIFRKALGKEYKVERRDYLLDGARRCSYRVLQR